MDRLFLKFCAFAVPLLVISGCVSIPKDAGRSDVREISARRGLELPETDQVEQRVSALTADALTANAAVEIGLLIGPEAQRIYAGLGEGAAEAYRVGRMSNPMLSASVLDPDEPGERDLITLGLTTALVDAVTLPMRSRLARAEFTALKESVAGEFLEFAAGTKKSFYHFVAKKQSARMHEQIATAADVSARLAERFHQAGNISDRELVESLAVASEAKLESLEAAAEAYGARHDLANQIGLPIDGDWDAPASLPGLPGSEGALETSLVQAREQRLDLKAARVEASVTAERHGMTRWSRWLEELEIGVERERETDGAELKGPTLDWSVPLFDQHRDELLEQNAAMIEALADFQAVRLSVDNGVRLSHGEVMNARQRVEEYEQVLLPNRVRNSELAQQEVNFMLIGVFELFEVKKEEYEAYKDYLESLEQYWVARIHLAMETGHMLMPESGVESVSVEDLIAPSPVDHSGHEGMDHSGHDMSDHAGQVETLDAEHDHGGAP